MVSEKNRSQANKAVYLKQCNYCVSIRRKTKCEYYGKINERDIMDNKQFWKTIEPLFFSKTKSSEKVTLVEDDKTFTQDTKNSQNAEI